MIERNRWKGRVVAVCARCKENADSQSPHSTVTLLENEGRLLHLLM